MIDAVTARLRCDACGEPFEVELDNAHGGPVMGAVASAAANAGPPALSDVRGDLCPTCYGAALAEMPEGASYIRWPA